MTEYITKDAAICIADYTVDEHPYDRDPEKPETSSEYNRGWHDACDIIRARLENEENADASPIRRGQWVDFYGGKYDNPRYMCSVCGEAALYRRRFNELNTAFWKQELSPYCPHCGATNLRRSMTTERGSGNDRIY